MCHVVAGYPDRETCLQVMLGLQEKQVAAIEVQVPFSDPIADGETIMRANDVALEGGMTIAGSFELIEEARRRGVNRDIYIMSYLQKVTHFDPAEFCERAAACGVKGLIIPDLPYESPEYALLLKNTGARGLELMPVLSPGMPEERLEALLKAEPPHVYVTSRRGITGSEYAGNEELEAFVGKVKSRLAASVMIGFGISTPSDVEDVLKIGDIAVVGSAIIKQLQKSDVAKTLDYVAGLTSESPESPEREDSR
jgi:tryptophan synthase alpha subunit